MNKNIFLKQSYQDAWSDYEYACTHPDAANWDYVIITASNRFQADSYQLQIGKRTREGFFPSNMKFLVIPDLNDERVGSGGATLNALFVLAQKVGIEKVANLKILMMHSGGDSKRIPQYSACGKLFAPVPRVLPNGKKSTVFDELLISVAGVPARIGGGLLVLPGDTEILFNPLQLDLLSCDAAGLSIKVGIEEGTEHGVFLQGTDSSDHRNRNVARFLHKQSEASLRKNGAVDSFDNVDIDTGCIWFGSRVVESLLQLISDEKGLSEAKRRKMVNPKVCLSFYADFVYPLADESTLEDYYQETPEGVFSEELRECRLAIWEKLQSFHLSLVRMHPARYIHFGMTHEMFDLLVWDIEQYSFLGWEKRIFTNASSGRVINSIVDSSVKIPEDCFIEDSKIGRGCKIGSGCIISGVDIEDTDIPDGIVIHGLRLNDSSYICRIYGKEDNPKDSKSGRFLGGSLDNLMKKATLKHSDLWDTPPASIWNARLYVPGKSYGEAVENALSLYRILNGKASEEVISHWKESQRYSLKESFNLADVSYMLDRQDRIEQMVRVSRALETLSRGEDAGIAEKILGNYVDDAALSILYKKGNEAVFPLNMRIYLMLSDMCRSQKKEISGLTAAQLEDLAYACVKSEVTQATISHHPFAHGAARFRESSFSCEMPVRINFCGSPSDAAPYCLEHGGTMLDAAILLNGKKPIIANIDRLEKPVFVLESMDQGEEIEISDVSEIRNCGDPYDKFVLLKAIIVASGLVSVEDDGRTLKDICDEIGGGLKLSTSAKVPKGSGLGTSSIIAAAGIKALNAILGQDVSDDRIYSQVFLAEQLMNTGGGWQDQVGGFREGLKYFTSRPSSYQKIKVENVVLSQETQKELDERFALIFSGQRRLARNVLREEMNQCIRNNREAMDAIARIREYCALMKFYLEKGDITAFAGYITKQFDLVKLLDRGASNTCIEYIFSVCDDLIDGKCICGAGGGGFLQVILKKGISKEQLRERIDREFAGCGVEVWDAEILF